MWKRLAVIPLCYALLAPAAGQAQTELPKDVYRALDSFTGDTIYRTKYGRLDNPQQCGRSDIGLVWRLDRGERGSTEWLTYDWVMVDAPFSRKARWLNAVGAVLNIDGNFVELERHPMTPNLSGGGDGYYESGQFRLPPGTMADVLAAKDVKVRFAGTEMTCDGTLEPNMISRLRALHDWLD